LVNQIVGHYHIEAKIGEGQFASVYMGHDIRLNRMVAVKILKKQQGDSMNFGRLLREARVASTLNHPNICSIFDIGEDQDKHFLVLELIKGRTLKATLDSGPLPLRNALQVALAIGEALAHAHSAGVLHGDLAPSNVMLTPQGDVKVIDFGLARSLDADGDTAIRKCPQPMEQQAYLWGTLPYTAPEILRGEEGSVQSDLWSLGAILYEMFTGNLPFPGRTAFEVGMSVMVGRMEPIPAQVPPSPRAIVCRCLAVKRSNRYVSAEEICLHLREELLSMNRLRYMRSEGARSLMSSIASLFSTVGHEK
jgi:eukaryotic-like serine/threonine-protein kinase